MDNYIVSARKYRPANFRSVIGQKSLTTTLKNAILNNKLAHAYLFCGPRGVGKTTCARIFAKSINCLHPNPDGEACDECESCLSFNENRSYNIHELDAASNNGVDDIRSLTEQVRIPPQIGKYKVYIIDEVHMLSSGAFNAFLKTLEEPPRHAIFILATTEKHKLLATILSRCQIYDFNRIHINDIVEYLEYVAQQENVSVEKEALNVIAQKADGGMRDALSIFDQIVSFSQGNVTYKSVIDNLNVLDYEYYFTLTDAILRGDVQQNLLLLDEILKKGFDGQHFVTGLASFFRDILVCRDSQTIVLFEVGDAIKEKYVRLAQQCPENFLYKALEWTNECDLNYRISKNKRLLVEILLIRLCRLHHSPEPDDDKKKTVIEPAAVTQPSQTPASVVQNGQKTVPVEPVRTSVENVVPHIPKEEPEKKAVNTKIPISFSLKNHLNKEETKADLSPKEEQKVLNEAFNQEDLIRVWNNFAAQEDDVHLKNTLLNFSPVLKENHCIEIEVSNPTQEAKLNERAGDLFRYLATHLNNTSIRTEIKIKESYAGQSPFTNKEKYQFMASKNPALSSLVKEFNLRLD
jgi:DNA polymerase-3 subunit gamma/tau